MKAVQEPCEVDTRDGKPVTVRWRGRAYRVTRVLDEYRAGARWWLGEPSRTVWVVECGHVIVEICLWDQAEWHAQGWWVLRMQD